MHSENPILQNTAIIIRIAEHFIYKYPKILYSNLSFHFILFDLMSTLHHNKNNVTLHYSRINFLYIIRQNITIIYKYTIKPTYKLPAIFI
jgi:hypothetical protein